MAETSQERDGVSLLLLDHLNGVDVDIPVCTLVAHDDRAGFPCFEAEHSEPEESFCERGGNPLVYGDRSGTVGIVVIFPQLSAALRSFPQLCAALRRFTQVYAALRRFAQLGAA